MPEKWILPFVCSIAALIGRSCLRTIDVVCLPTTEPDSFLAKYLNVENLSYKQIQLYLKVSISDFLSVFAARTHGFLFTRRPGVLLGCAAVFATGTSTLLSWLWPFHDMEPVPGTLMGIIWAYCPRLVHHPERCEGFPLRVCEPCQLLNSSRVSGNERQ